MRQMFKKIRNKKRLHYIEMFVIVLIPVLVIVLAVFMVVGIIPAFSRAQPDGYDAGYVLDEPDDEPDDEPEYGNGTEYEEPEVIGEGYETPAEPEYYYEYEDYESENGFLYNISRLDFFLEHRLEEYIAFYYERPDLCYEYVVWKVNANLNREFFDNPHIITDPHPFLVNPFNKLPYDFSPAGMQRIPGTEFRATPETIRAFNAFQEYARTHGHNLWVASSYRSISHQRNLYARSTGRGAIARPGHSEHHTGRALDLGGPLGLLDRWQEYPTSDTALWIVDNAYKFGFIIRYTIENRHITGIIGEPWHITYVTEYVSRRMHEAGYSSLEEFVARNPGFVFQP